MSQNANISATGGGVPTIVVDPSDPMGNSIDPRGDNTEPDGLGQIYIIGGPDSSGVFSVIEIFVCVGTDPMLSGGERWTRIF